MLRIGTLMTLTASQRTWLSYTGSVFVFVFLLYVIARL
jgi:hypothetical protein